MEKKGKRCSASPGTITPCHGAYLEFLNGLLAYLRDAQADEEQQRRDLAKIEKLAERLRSEIVGCAPTKQTGADKQLDEVVRLARDYYPSEGDSHELSQAIETLSKTMHREYGIT